MLKDQHKLLYNTVFLLGDNYVTSLDLECEFCIPIIITEYKHGRSLTHTDYYIAAGNLFKTLYQSTRTIVCRNAVSLINTR